MKGSGGVRGRGRVCGRESGGEGGGGSRFLGGLGRGLGMFFWGFRGGDFRRCVRFSFLIIN